MHTCFRVTVQNPRLRKWIAGEPATLIQNGHILEDVMGQMGYTLDSLKQALRGKDIFHIEEVECAILEIDGSLSVLKKTKYQSATKQDLTIIASKGMVPVELICDGKILYENLLEHGYDEAWLIAQLKKRNLTVMDIFYAVVGTKGNLHIETFKNQ